MLLSPPARRACHEQRSIIQLHSLPGQRGLRDGKGALPYRISRDPVFRQSDIGVGDTFGTILALGGTQLPGGAGGTESQDSAVAQRAKMQDGGATAAFGANRPKQLAGGIEAGEARVARCPANGAATIAGASNEGRATPAVALELVQGE